MRARAEWSKNTRGDGEDLLLELEPHFASQLSPFEGLSSTPLPLGFPRKSPHVRRPLGSPSPTDLIRVIYGSLSARRLPSMATFDSLPPETFNRILELAGEYKYLNERKAVRGGLAMAALVARSGGSPRRPFSGETYTWRKHRRSGECFPARLVGSTKRCEWCRALSPRRRPA